MLRLEAPLSEDLTLRAIRRWLAVSLLAGIAGTGVELLLIGHWEQATQYAPLVLLFAGLVALTQHLVSPSRTSVRAVQVLMVLFVATGGVGIGLHARGNEEFERELHPANSGWALLMETLTGATPVLAPGSLSLLGLIGLAYVYRHPAARD